MPVALRCLSAIGLATADEGRDFRANHGASVPLLTHRAAMHFAGSKLSRRAIGVALGVAGMPVPRGGNNRFDVSELNLPTEFALRLG